MWLDNMVMFGDYNIEFISFSHFPSTTEALFKLSIAEKERKPFSDENIKVFFSSYIEDIGKWENMLCIKEALMKTGQELFEGVDFPLKYTIQNHNKLENIFSIHKITSQDSQIKIVEIKCKYNLSVERDDFITHMKNVDKWRSLNQNVMALKKLLKQL